MFSNSVQVRRVIRWVAGLGLAMPALASTEDTVRDESSRGHRARSAYSLEIQPLGLGDGLASGVMGSYYAQADLHIGLKYLHGEEVSSILDTYKAHSDVVALTLKDFVGNSFYLEAGPGVRRKYVHRTNEDILPGDIQVSHASSYSRTDVGFLIGLGNQWEWSHFTIGCEWIGAYIPASSTTVKGNKEEIREDGTRRNVSLDHSDKTGETTIRLLNFHLGLVF